MGTHPIYESDFDCLTEPNMKLFGFFGLLGVVFSEEAARLIASKTTESKILAQNVDLTFTYKIFNIGQGSAFNVEMKDENFDTDFEVVGGSSEGKWDVIEKDSSVTHEVTVRALKAGAQKKTSPRTQNSSKKPSLEKSHQKRFQNLPETTAKKNSFPSTKNEKNNKLLLLIRDLF